MSPYNFCKTLPGVLEAQCRAPRIAFDSYDIIADSIVYFHGSMLNVELETVADILRRAYHSRSHTMPYTITFKKLYRILRMDNVDPDA